MNEFLTQNQMIHGELFLALMVLIIIIEGVLLKMANPIWLAILGLSLTVFTFINSFPSGQLVAFDGFLFVNQLTQLGKIIVVLAAMAVLIMSHQYISHTKIARLEYAVITLLAVLGMLVIISANNFLVMYLGLELMSLGLYVLAAIDRNNPQSAEAGLKYFITGSLASALMLYGISVIYGFTGSISYETVSDYLLSQQYMNIAIGMALLLIIVAMAFKLSAAPFHQWTPDVYAGAPIPVVALFATAAKVAALLLLIRILFDPLVALSDVWKIILQFLAVLSMVWGAIAGLRQDNIKRLLGYSSIINMGYILGTISTTTTESIASVLLFIIIYVITNLGIFAVLPLIRIDGAYIRDVSQLKGLAKTQPKIALGLMILLFSIIGMPPLGGFIGKLFLLNSMTAVQILHIALLLVLSSVIAAFYYLRIIRTMYFDDATDNFDAPNDFWGRAIFAVMVILVLVFIFFAAFVVNNIGALHLGFGVE